MRRVALAVLALGAAIWAVTQFTGDDDDVPVDPTRPDARRAATIAQGVVPGRVLEVARDRDNGKWEVIIAQDGREYEIELAPRSLTLLRLDYD